MSFEKFVANGWTAAMPEGGGWEDRSLITLVEAADASGGFASNIVVTRERTGMNVEEFAALQGELMRRELGGALQILDERAIEIGGVSSYQRLQRFDGGGGQILQQVQTFFTAENAVYAVTGTASLENFDRAIPAFKKFVETFRLS